MGRRIWLLVAGIVMAARSGGTIPPPWTLEEAKAEAPVVVICKVLETTLLREWRGPSHKCALDVIKSLHGQATPPPGKKHPYLVFRHRSTLPPNVMITGGRLLAPERGETVLLFMRPAVEHVKANGKTAAEVRAGYYTEVAGGSGYMKLDPLSRRPLGWGAETMARMDPKAREKLARYYAAGRAHLAGSLMISVPELPGSKDLETRMASHYEPVQVSVRPKARRYKLPIQVKKLSNGREASRFVRDKAARDALLENGFVVVDDAFGDDIAGFYSNLKDQGIPVFVTSDSLLHLYHVWFAETLRSVEEREFVGDLTGIAEALQGNSAYLHSVLAGDAREAARRCLGLATVALELLAQETLRPRMEELRQKVALWEGEGTWLQINKIRAEYPEAMAALSRILGPPTTDGKFVRRTPRPLDGKSNIVASIEDYAKKYAGGKTMDVSVPAAVAAEVAGELALITRHEGVARSPLMNYAQDYSHFQPRGHYTRSEQLKRYYRAMTWFGRMAFLTGGAQDGGGLVSEPEARIHTLAAALLSSMIDEATLPPRRERTVAQAWDRIYAVSAYYSGFADDLTPYEYRAAMRKVFGVRFPATKLNQPKLYDALVRELAALRAPQIYGGAGDVAAANGARGLRFMGQRFVPDSYIMGRVVHPAVGAYNGLADRPGLFTAARTQAGLVRGFPCGLDVMAVLGSDRAREIIHKQGDDRYERYDEALDALREEFRSLSDTEESKRGSRRRRVERLSSPTRAAGAPWQRSTYWSCLHCLEALLDTGQRGLPSFMQTDAWRDRQLNAALASWAQLRHDAVLCAKPDYTPKAAGDDGSGGGVVEGYVEPVPEFYGRMLALTRMTLKALKDMKVLEDKSLLRLRGLERICEDLLEIAVKELEGQELDERDHEFIRSFGENLAVATVGSDRRGLATAVIADVHTEANTGRILHEATGRLRTMFVAYPVPDGGIVVGAGPVLSYYEFKTAPGERMTNERWRSVLRSRDCPQPPAWTSSHRR